MGRKRYSLDQEYPPVQMQPGGQLRMPSVPQMSVPSMGYQDVPAMPPRQQPYLSPSGDFMGASGDDLMGMPHSTRGNTLRSPGSFDRKPQPFFGNLLSRNGG
jgi:hypothetical protein